MDSTISGALLPDEDRERLNIIRKAIAAGSPLRKPIYQLRRLLSRSPAYPAARSTNRPTIHLRRYSLWENAILLRRNKNKSWSSICRSCGLKGAAHSAAGDAKDAGKQAIDSVKNVPSRH
jgi:hypothetical protein